MGLLAHYRQRWIAIAIALLWLPLVGQVLLPAERMSTNEARTLRAAPSLPKSWADWIKFPHALDGFLADHFGFRKQLTHANAFLRYAASSSTNPAVLIGRDHFLFYLGDEAVPQSAGLIIRPKLIQEFADFVGNLHDRLAQHNIKFLFTIVPNSSTINRAKLPSWVAAVPKVTEYDLTLDLIAKRGVQVLDLRPPIMAADKIRPTYQRTDTHWNGLAALVARNEIFSAIGLPERRIDYEPFFRGYQKDPGGDLARFLGVNTDVVEEVPLLDLSSFKPVEGPTMVVIGDSFTQNYFPGLWRNGGKFIWIYHARCRFDFNEVLAKKPDVVVFAPTERYASCA